MAKPEFLGEDLAYHPLQQQPGARPDPIDATYQRLMDKIYGTSHGQTMAAAEKAALLTPEERAGLYGEWSKNHVPFDVLRERDPAGVDSRVQYYMGIGYSEGAAKAQFERDNVAKEPLSYMDKASGPFAWVKEHIGPMEAAIAVTLGTAAYAAATAEVASTVPVATGGGQYGAGGVVSTASGAGGGTLGAEGLTAVGTFAPSASIGGATFIAPEVTGLATGMGGAVIPGAAEALASISAVGAGLTSTLNLAGITSTAGGVASTAKDVFKNASGNDPPPPPKDTTFWDIVKGGAAVSLGANLGSVIPDLISAYGTEVIKDAFAPDPITSRVQTVKTVFPEGAELPTLEFPEFEMPEREFDAPTYREPEYGEMPSLEVPPVDTRAISAKAQEAEAAGTRRIENAVQRALNYGVEDPSAQATAIEDILAGKGQAIAGVMAGAGQQALREQGVERGYGYNELVRNYNAKREMVERQRTSDLDAAQKNFMTLSGAYDRDLASAQQKAELDFNANIQTLTLEFDAKKQQYLLSGTQTITEKIYS